MKNNLLSLYSDILNEGEKEINLHLDDEKSKGVVKLSEEIGEKFNCDHFLVYQILKSYIDDRGDIFVKRGRDGGIKRKSKPAEQKESVIKYPDPIIFAVKDEDIQIVEEKKEVVEDTYLPPVLFPQNHLKDISKKVEDKVNHSVIVQPIATEQPLSEAPKSIVEASEAKETVSVEPIADPNALPSWASAKIDPIANKYSNKRVWK